MTEAAEEIFEPILAEILALQSDLRRMEDDFHALQRQTITEYGYTPLHGPFHAIQAVEREIVWLKSRVPPYAVDRGNGVIEMLPVLQPINPRGPPYKPSP